jgi:hypothetical protein
MTIITLEDIQRHDEEGNKQTLYCPKKSEASFRLSKMSSLKRGTQLERVIAEKIEHHTGYESNALRGNQAWDITVNLDDNPVRIEVKSALHHPHCVTSYQMQNIKPKNFDYIFFVLVTPEDIIVKWASVKDVKKACKNKNRHANGFAISINENSIPDYLYDLEDFPYNPKDFA